jgi:hypothetical protein
MAEAWARIVNTTISEYVRGEEENVMRNRKLTALLKKRGRVTFNHAGKNHDWKVRYKRALMTGYADGDTLSFARKDRHKSAVLDWRGYSATDSVTKFEQLQNKGTAAIVSVFSQTATMLMDDMTDQFGDELYIDGNATGNSKRMHGLESALAHGALLANSPVHAPADVYAGLQCSLGHYGGAWSQAAGATTWPVGTGDAHYDFWSPLIVDYGNAAFSATATWAANSIKAMRYGIAHQARNRSKKSMMDLVLLDPDLYRQFLDANEAKQQIHIRRGDGQGLVSLGFEDTINFDGIEVTKEFGVPAAVGYGLAIDQLELMSLQGQLFEPMGPDMEISTKAYRFSIDFFGNLKFNPRHMVKFRKGS